jgi:DNA-binding transcriptional ArsR family regulator
MKYTIYQFKFGKDQSELWGRTRGREIREQIEAILNTVPPGAAMHINMATVQVMDVSFSVELFGRLYGSMAISYPERALVLEKVDEDVQDNIDAAFQRLNLLALIINGTNWELIGKTSETDRETLQALYLRKEASAADLADAMDIKLTACNQRLKKLTDAGIVIRTKMSAPSGGDQYLYKWPA